MLRYEKSVRNVGVLIGTTSLNDSSAVSRNIETMFHYERFNPKTNMDDFTLVQASIFTTEILTFQPYGN